MTGAYFRDAPRSLARHVREAVKALDYFEHDRAEELVVVFEYLWPRGMSDTALIYNDLPEMTEEQKLAAGLGRSRMPLIIWELLTEKGRADHRHACKATTLRVEFNLRRQENKQQERFWSSICTYVEFAGVTDHCCQLAHQMKGQVYHRKERPRLPLKGCRQEWCSCRWDHITD